jgi:hypothetical protein
MRERQSYSFLFMYFFLFFLPLFFFAREKATVFFTLTSVFLRDTECERESARERERPLFLLQSL